MNEKKQKPKVKNDDKEKDWYSTVIVCQFFLCLLFTVSVFFLSRSEGSFAQNLKSRIDRVLTENIDTSQVADNVANIKQFFQGSSLAVDGTAITDIVLTTEGDTTESASDTTEEAVTTDTTAENGKTTDATTPEETTEDLSGMGGEDLKLFEATEKTSFSPYFTTDKFINPIENGRYTSYFGYRINPITKEWSFHTGLDIAAKEGTKIRTALSGTVSCVGEDSRAGKYIIVSHSDSFKTFYCHCSEILVEEGMKLNKGETIALVGSTGWSTGPHLHFEVRRNNIRLNPLFALSDDC